MKKSRLKLTLIFLTLLIFSALLSILLGSVKINISNFRSEAGIQILNLRIMRTILAFFAGAGLSLVGLMLQSVLRNPLVEPYCLGVSSGAALGAVLSMSLELSFVFTPFVAFLFAMITVFTVYRLALTNKKLSVVSLLLSGVIIGILLSSLTIFFVFLSSNEAVHGILWWLLGNLQIFDTKLLILVSIIVLGGIIASLFFTNELNAISLGEEEAMHLGIEVEKVKKLLFIISSLITASIVSVCGMIGFVGLIIPHIVRRIVGINHRITLLFSVFCGGVFLIVCDVVSRIILRPIEIPIGVITALIGAPFFIILLKKGQRIN